MADGYSDFNIPPRGVGVGEYKNMYVPLINVAIKTVLLHGSTTGKHVKKGKKKGSATYFFLFLEEVEELSCRPSSCIQKQHKVSREQGWDRKKTQSNNHQYQIITKNLQFLHCLLS